jgi:hypothetical protein
MIDSAELPKQMRPIIKWIQAFDICGEIDDRVITDSGFYTLNRLTEKLVFATNH